MLKSEVIKSNDLLKDLSDDQVGAIETLSQNDENTVIGKKTGEIHGQYDADIKEALGIEKPQGTKTYDFIKSTLLPQIKTAGDVKTQLSTSKEKITELEKTIAESSGDDNLKQQLKDSQDKVTQMTTSHTTALEEKATENKKLSGELTNTKLDIEFSNGIAGVKFKDEKLVSASLRSMAINSAQQNVLSKFTPDWIDNGQKGKQLVFRDKEGTIQNNPENKLNPVTAGELILREDSMKDVVDFGPECALSQSVFR